MRARQIVLINLLTLIVVAAALVGGYVYFYDRNNYVSEDDASIQADTHFIVGTAAGKLTKWTAAEGTKVHAGDVLGVETLPTGQTLNITAPSDGQIVKSAVIEGEVVAPGLTMAVESDIDKEYVVANIKESDIRNVKVGQSVDIYVDAYPGDTFTGTVERIGSESAASASPFPNPVSTGFTKQVQRIPVKISLSGKDGKDIIPTMNVSIRIHRNS